MNLNPSQARVIDPVLSTVAQGYKNAEMVANYLFPTVQVGARGGNIITFGREGFMLYASARAPGETTKRVKFGYAGSPFALVDYSLEGQIPIEVMQEANAVPGIDMAKRAINAVQDIMALRHEFAAASLATTLANYAASNKTTLAGAAQWSDPASDPVSDVATAREAIRAATGKNPNVMTIGPKVAVALKKNPKIIDRVKYTGRDIPTMELLASLFEIDKVVVGNAIWSNDAGTAFSDVWGKDAVLAFTQSAGVADAGLPSYGYTYNLNAYPLVEEAYYDRPSKSWIYPVARSEAPVIAGALAGYLIKAATA